MEWRSIVLNTYNWTSAYSANSLFWLCKGWGGTWVFYDQPSWTFIAPGNIPALSTWSFSCWCQLKLIIKLAVFYYSYDGISYMFWSAVAFRSLPVYGLKKLPSYGHEYYFLPLKLSRRYIFSEYIVIYTNCYRGSTAINSASTSTLKEQMLYHVHFNGWKSETVSIAVSSFSLLSETHACIKLKVSISG